jgi:hypothetical protein
MAAPAAAEVDGPGVEPNDDGPDGRPHDSNSNDEILINHAPLSMTAAARGPAMRARIKPDNNRADSDDRPRKAKDQIRINHAPTLPEFSRPKAQSPQKQFLRS